MSTALHVIWFQVQSGLWYTVPGHIKGQSVFYPHHPQGLSENFVKEADIVLNLPDTDFKGALMKKADGICLYNRGGEGGGKWG